jgi:IS66 C-terminal element
MRVTVAPRPFRLFVRNLESTARRVIFCKGAHNRRPFGRHKMRPIKLNAKNSLFVGCDEGAENWALLATLIETCKLNSVGAEHWLADVLAKLVNGWPAARLDELLPWASAYTMHACGPRLAA